MAAMGPMDSGESQSRDTEILASDRVGQPELADTRYLLLADT